MTITLFVEPKSLSIFLEITNILKNLPLDSNYTFAKSDIKFSESMISNYCWINIDVAEYVKLKYYMNKQI
jgi:hypothetical protein